MKGNMKKESVSSMVKQMACALRALVKRKTRALKARLIIYSLLARPNFLPNLTTLTHRQHHYQCQIQEPELAELADLAEAAESEAEAAELAVPTISGSCGGSVIEMVKHSKEEAGEEFSLEKDIDHVADLFITNFHRQMRMQNQNSLNTYHQMPF